VWCSARTESKQRSSHQRWYDAFMWRFALAVSLLAACTDDSSPAVEPRQTFDRSVFPVLVQKCAGNTSGCHGETSSSPLTLEDRDTAYATIIAVYAGNFADDVPLLNAHAPWQLLGPSANDMIQQWLAEERRARGL
jgi:hypothetical protein